MSDEITDISAVKTTSDGTVKISVEKYTELLEAAAVKPRVVNTTKVIKTAEMVARDYRMWGGGLMGLGASLFTIGAFLYRAGLK